MTPGRARGFATMVLVALGLTIAARAGRAMQVAATTGGPGVGRLGSTKPRWTIPTDALTSIAMHPSGRLLYGTHRSSSPLAGELVVFDWRARTELTRIQTGWFADEVVVDPTGTRGYLALADGVGVIDLTTNTLRTFIGIPEQSYHVALDASGSRLVATGTLVADGVTHGRITVIDTATEAVTDSIEVPDFLVGVAVTPDGSRAYVAAATATGGEITVFGTDPLAVVGHVSLDAVFPDTGAVASDLAMHPSGAELYASACAGDTNCVPGAVVAVDTRTDSVRTTIPMANVRGLAVDPRGKSLLVASGALVHTFRLTCTPALRRSANVGNAEAVAVRPCTKCARPNPPCP
jgi:DNA-binding beta-propeller fold protein YncE